MRKFIAFFAAAAFALAALAPVAEARDGRRGYYNDRGHHHGYSHRRHRGDDGAAVAAGVVGLVLGLAVGSALSQSSRPAAPRCTDNYQRCPAPQGYYGQQGYYAPPPPAYYQPSTPPARYGDDQGYYDDRSAYEQDYGYAPPRSQCTRRERQWDRYANQYVTVDVPC